MRLLYPVELEEVRKGVLRIAPAHLIAAKAALYLAMRQDDVRPAELARRMGVDQPAINRLLDPRHASRPAQFDAAFAALGRRLVLSLENAARPLEAMR